MIKNFIIPIVFTIFLLGCIFIINSFKCKHDWQQFKYTERLRKNNRKQILRFYKCVKCGLFKQELENV